MGVGDYGVVPLKNVTEESPPKSPAKSPAVVCSTHNYMIMFRPGFSCLKGKLCHRCGTQFMSGKKIAGSDPAKQFWPSAKIPAHRCADCGIAMCHSCKNYVDKSSQSPMHKRRRES